MYVSHIFASKGYKKTVIDASTVFHILSAAYVPYQLSHISAYLSQPTRSEMGVTSRSLGALVAQQMLNIIKRGITTIDQDRCEAVPQIMNSEVVSNPGSFLDSGECLLWMSDRSTGCISGKDIGVLGC